VLDTSKKSKLSQEEIEKRLKVVKDFFDNLGQQSTAIDADRMALMDRQTKLTDDYFGYIEALQGLLSPQYQQRLEEVASHDELTHEEVASINEELQIIGEEYGIADMGEYMQRAAEKFLAEFTTLQTSISKLDDRDMELIEEMEGFSP